MPTKVIVIVSGGNVQDCYADSADVEVEVIGKFKGDASIFPWWLATRLSDSPGARLQRLGDQTLTAVEAAGASSVDRVEGGGFTRAATERWVKNSWRMR